MLVGDGCLRKAKVLLCASSLPSLSGFVSPCVVSPCVSILFVILFIWMTSLAAAILVTSGPPQPRIMHVKRSEEKKDAFNRTEHLWYQCENKEDERKRGKAKMNHCSSVHHSGNYTLRVINHPVLQSIVPAPNRYVFNGCVYSVQYNTESDTPDLAQLLKLKFLVLPALHC